MIELNLQKKLDSGRGKMNLEVHMNVKKGQFASLYGDSGAGKTSTLRLLSGLLKPDSGSIRVEAIEWYNSEKGLNIPSQKRGIGYVFQDYALFPNMTVLENLQYALPKNATKEIISELIDFTELGELANRKPETLSGGQKQRVAVARALVNKPEILILDEPFSALDTKMRLKLQDYILNVHKKYGLTTILVSHDIPEIIKLSDVVFELENGCIIRSGTPADFFGANKSSAKFRFTGEVLDIQKEEVIYVVCVLIGKDMVKIVCDKNEAEKLALGDKVFVASKAFNPIIQKM